MTEAIEMVAKQLGLPTEKLNAFVLEFKGREISYTNFRRNFGEQFPESSKALAAIRRVEVDRLSGKNISYEEILKMFNELNKIYNTK